MKFGDRRRDTRYSIQFPAQLVIGRQKRALMTSDVSRSGVFLRTDEPLALRQLVRLQLILPDGDLAIAAHGMAVHIVEPSKSSPERIPGVGIQFYAIDRETRIAWSAFVKQVEASCPKAPDQTPLKSQTAAPIAEPIRRHAVRHPAVLRVKVSTADELVDLYSKNVSKGGMYIETPAKIAIGTSVIVVVIHPQTHDPFLLEAVVRHHDQGPRNGVGVEFVGLDAATRDSFLDFARAGIIFDDVATVNQDDPQLA